MSNKLSSDGGRRIDRRTVMKTAGLVSVGLIAGPSALITQAEAGVGENVGFITNASDGTVSRIDLLDPTAEDETIPIVDPYDGELTNRMVIEPETGNPWVLNTGRGLLEESNGEESQGQVVEIERESDETTAYDVGDIGEKPRAIEWVDGHVWVGFYDGDDEQYLLKLDPQSLDDTEVATEDGDPGIEQHVGLGSDVRPYTLLYDDYRETLWLTSRTNSRMSAPGEDSIYSIGLGNESPSVAAENDDLSRPYFGTLDGEDTVWVTDFAEGNPEDGEVAVYDFEGNGEWIQVTIPDGGTFRGVVADENDDIWLASAAGEVIRLDSNDNYSIGFRAPIGSDNVGIGIDARNQIWVVDRIDGVIRRIDPAADTDTVAQTIELGDEPYAYADFVVEES